MGVKESPTSSHLLSKLAQSPWALPIAVSMVLVIPCFWQPIVSGSDLQSHLYNAWLAELIRGGTIHGLWIGHQSTNVLIDMLLSLLLTGFGVSVAERVATTALVLIFFWGAFHFISAVRGQAAYWLAPWLAILSYGIIFQVGLMNFYLSCGIVFWLFAILWRQRFAWRALWAAPLLLLSYLAHPLPVIWFLCVASYCWLALRIRGGFQILLFLGSVVALFLIRGYVVARYITIWKSTQLVGWTGVDQSLLYGWPYLPVALGFLLFSVVLLARPENRWRAIVSVLAQAYFLTAVAVIVMPFSVRASMDSAWAGIISHRLSLFSGVLLLAVLSRSSYRRWFFPAGLLTAAIFFVALYCDIGREARVEAKMERLVKTLPAGDRVVSFADLSNGEEFGNLPAGEGRLAHLTKRILSLNRRSPIWTHLVSRACLGHCFDYMNYEPSTNQFRIHASPGNPAVLATYVQIDDMEWGNYLVKASDLPLYALIRCGPGPEDIFMEPMAIGESGTMLPCPGTAARQ
jgi:hypothetical protein